MKKDVITKLLNAAKGDYTIEKILFNIFLILIFSSQIFSQISIEGFGRAVEIEAFSDFKKIQVLDFNEDGQDDFILYGADKKEVGIVRSLKNGALSAPIHKFFFYPMTEIAKLQKREDFGAFYIVLSRAKRLVSLITFTKYGTLQLLNQHKFASFPSELLIADLNNDGRNEALVYGGNFDGISVISEEKFILKERKILEGKPISQIAVMDFNYDGYNDLVCYDVLNSSLLFLKNNAGFSFDVEREVKIISEPLSLDPIDSNSDSFTDLLIAFNNKVKIMFGDSVSSFSKSISKEVSEPIAKIEAIKINKDSFPDLILLLKNKGELAALFNRKGKGFSNLESLVSGKRIIDFYVKDSSRTQRLYLYSSAGKIFKLLNPQEFPKRFVFVGNGKPKRIFKTTKNLLFLFQKNDMLGKDYYYWGREPLPRFFTYRFSDEKSQNYTLLESPKKMNLLSYTVGKNFISILTFGLRGQSKFFLQSFPQKILDVQVFYVKKSRVEKTAILFADSLNNISLKTFEIKKDTLFENGNTALFKLSANSFGGLRKRFSIAWQNLEDSTTLFVECSNNGVKKETQRNEVGRGTINIELQKGVALKSLKNYGVKFSNNKLLFWNKKFGEKTFRLPPILKKLVRRNYTAENYFSPSLSKQFSLLYNPKEKQLFKIVYSWKTKKLKVIKLIESVPLNDYFVTSFKRNNVYLIYSDSTSSVLNFLRIDEE